MIAIQESLISFKQQFTHGKIMNPETIVRQFSQDIALSKYIHLFYLIHSLKDSGIGINLLTIFKIPLDKLIETFNLVTWGILLVT